MEYYTCTKCKENKPSTDFHSNGKITEKKKVRSKCKVCILTKEERRRANVKTRYGITQSDYETMLKNQNNSCAICKTTVPGYDNFCIDHCHKTGRVRGLLCRRCNLAIGHLNDDPLLCIEASKYLSVICDP